MNGAQLIIRTAAAAGVKYCFANPGTTEMQLVEALDSAPGIQAKLGLFEGCCTGAADGYFRMTGVPALTLLHLGPGLANGIANLHNAHRAKSGVVNIIGDHATWHRDTDAPLSMDIKALAGTIPGWVRTAKSVDTLSQDTCDAITAAMSGQVASLIVPQDIQWADIPETKIATPVFKPDLPDEKTLTQAADALLSDEKTLLILGGTALRETGLTLADRLKKASRCDVLSDTFPAHAHAGKGLMALKRVPYFPEQAIELLQQYTSIICIGTKPIVSFFGYQNSDCCLISDRQNLINLTPGRQDPVDTLAALYNRITGTAATSETGNQAQPERQAPELPQGKLTGKAICMTVTSLLPENAIVVEEAVTSGGTYPTFAQYAAKHSLLTLTGGSLGMGMPCAVGAATACPERPVINLQGDGAAMYTPQSLWMQARDQLNVTTLICANKSYNILKTEYRRAGYSDIGGNTRLMTTLDNPSMDFVMLGESMGVPAVSVNTAEELAKAFQEAMKTKGPRLIEMIMS